jgi:hypothetical protein
MKRKTVVRQDVGRLFDARNQFDTAIAAEKLQLLRRLAHTDVRTSAELIRLHSALCFIQAFPDTISHYQLARSMLQSFEDRVTRLPVAAKTRLADSGIAGTPVYYRFSYEVAVWMARRVPGEVSLDWDELDDASALDELLEQLLHPAETDFFDSGFVSCREWIELSATGIDGTDFDWLLAQLGEKHLAAIWSQLYNRADLPLTWSLRGSEFSKSKNTFAVRSVKARGEGLRKKLSGVKKEIMRPLETIKKLSSYAGSRLIDVAMASLAVRHRETIHFNHANSQEVYLADVGEGVSIAVFGLQHKYRYPLECTMGFLILANGMPVGYGGASSLFRQVNTGINIFDEYRGGEAAFIWIQVMRVYHHLSACTRFIANPYQFGSENTEALKSGAFWFYYRLGYRPVLPDVRRLAHLEWTRIQSDRSYRCDIGTLRQLARCDMHLTLPGARASELFEEHWIETSSMLAARELAAAGGSTRVHSSERVATKLTHDLGIRNLKRWSPALRNGFQLLAPIILAAGPGAWPKEAKQAMTSLLHAKGGPEEANYARLLGQQNHFLSTLRRKCRAAEKNIPD